MFALYEGGHRLNLRIKRFFHEAPADKDNTDLYERKLNIAKPQHINYFSQVINYYTGYLFSHPMNFNQDQDGELGEYYSTLKEDCTGNGTDFHELLREAFRGALIGRVSAIACELPVLDSEVTSLLDWETKKAGDATLKLFNALDIVDYEFSKTGALVWITLREKETFRPSPLSDEHFTRETFRVYTDEELQIFTFEYKGKSSNDLEPVKTESLQHGFTSVPVVLLDLDDTALGPKLEAPQHANWIARAQRAILLNSHANSVPVFCSGVESIKGAYSSGYGIQLEPGDTVDFIRPPAESLDALQNAIQDTGLELFRVANLHFLGERSSSMPWRSGASKQLDQDAGNITVRSYGFAAREMAEGILNLIARARGDNITIRVNGFEHLQTESLEDLVLIGEKLQKVDLTSKTFSLEFNKRLVSQALKDLDEKTKQIIFKELAEEPEKLPTVQIQQALENNSNSLNQESEETQPDPTEDQPQAAE